MLSDSLLVLVSNAANSLSRLFFYFTLNRHFSDLLISQTIVSLVFIEVMAVVLELGINRSHMMQDVHHVKENEIISARQIRSVLSILVVIFISLFNQSFIYLLILPILSFNYVTNLFLKELLFKKYFWNNLLSSFVLIIICCFYFYYEMSIWILLSGYFGGKIISTIYNWRFFNYDFKFLLNGIFNILDFKKNIVAFKVSSVYALISSVTTFLRKGDIFYFNYYTTNPTDVKYLGFFFSFTAFFPLITGALRNSLLPKSLKKSNINTFIVKNKFQILGLFVIVGCIFSVLLRTPFSMFYSIDNQDILFYFVIVCVATAINSTSTFFQIPLMGNGKNLFILKITFIQLIAQAVLSIILVPLLGLLGSVIVFSAVRMFSIIAYAYKL